MAMIFNPNFKMVVKVDDQIVGSIQTDKIETSATETKDIGLVYAPYIPVYRHTLFEDTITFKYKDKTFAIHPVNEKLAKKLVKSKINILITYLQYDKDDGIVQLVKFLCGLKYKQSTRNDIKAVFEQWTKLAAKQIADDIDKKLFKLMLGDNNGKK